MGAGFVKLFKNGNWLNRSKSMLADKTKVLALVAALVKYLKKGGLAKVKDDLMVLAGYIGDVVQGRYKDYSGSSLSLAVAAILYVVSPLDIVPDLLPLGFIDDISIVTWAVSRMTAELEKYREWKGKQITNK